MKLYLLSRIAFASASAVALAVGAHAQSGRHLDVNVSPCFEIFEIELDAGKDLLPFRLSDSLSLTSKGELDPPQFRCIGAGGIQLLIDRVQNELMARGFVTSRVLAEPQNLQSGKLKLKVLMGKIQQINWEPQANAQLKRATSFNTLPAKEGDILNLKDIEQGLENFKRVPTAEADIQIVPGDHPGYSNLRITHAQDRLFRFSVSWDDSGTPSTGNFHIPFKLFDTNLTYSLNTRFQHNLNRLTSQDMFSIGGRFTVRGFDGINTLSGDRGWLVRNDVSADMAAGHKFYVGIDKGAVGGPAAETLVGQSLSGAVIGLRGQKDALQYDFFVGGPIEKPDRFKTAKVTTGFNLSLNF